MASMSQAEMRAELARRGLVSYGDNQALKSRLEKDEAHGLFKGDLQGMSEEYLREGCKLLSIPSTGDKGTLIDKIERYNEWKRQKLANEEREGEINAGLPRPDDWLGVPTGAAILGTRGSLIYSKPYSEYLAEHSLANGTTKDALTFRYWRTLRYPNVPADELWPVRYYDGRINASDDIESEA